MKPKQVVYTLDFTTDEIQYYKDLQQKKVRRCIYKGRCPICNRRMYWFVDGKNDSCGALGTHGATYMTPKDENISEDDTPFWYCFLCADDRSTYLLAVELLRQREKADYE